MKKMFFPAVLAALSVSVFTARSAMAANGSLTPHFKQSSYVNESVTLENKYVTMNFFKRIKGWGWGEILTPEGKLMAVMDHLGELMIRDQDIPMRFEADSVSRVRTDDGESLVFNVKSVVVREMLKGTSFDNWMHYPYGEPAITGTVTITVTPDSPFVKLKYDLTATGNYYLRYLRGPWLKVGESSFGTKKDDAILPGVDWAIGDEWTSGSDFFKDPWALRVVPHPNKVSVPLMAISYEGDGIGLAWDPNAVAARWFNYRTQHPQPVFASPNFVDRMNNQLMGLMIPDASVEGHENEIYSQIAPELRIGEKIEFDAELWLSKGNSVDVVTDWVKRHGLPEPSAPKWDYRKALDLMAGAYNTNLWHEGHGFGVVQRSIDEAGPNIPGFLRRYMNENKKSQVVKELQAKIESLQPKEVPMVKIETPEQKKARQVKHGDEILAIQRADGSFAFEPDGRHYRKDDFKVATSFVEPMGLDGATALDITILPAMELLQIGKETGEQRFLDAGKKAIDFCMSMTRPEGGDFWETPLHAANLFAAGQGVRAVRRSEIQGKSGLLDAYDPAFHAPVGAGGDSDAVQYQTGAQFERLVLRQLGARPCAVGGARRVRSVDCQRHPLGGGRSGDRLDEVPPRYYQCGDPLDECAYRRQLASAQYSGDVRPLQRGCVRLLFPRYAQCDDGQLRRYVYSSFRYRGQHLLPVGPRSRGGKR